MPHKKFIISLLVENKVGVLQRITGVFSKRKFNLLTITVGETETPEVSRMTITTEGDEDIKEQIVKQLNKMVEVLKVSEILEGEAVIREIALIKITAKDFMMRSEIINYAEIFRGRIVDVGKSSVTVEITGTPEKTDAFLKLVKSFGIKEMVRTGVTAIARG